MFSDRTNWPLTRNRFTLALDALRASGIPLLDLTASNPTQCGFHYDSGAILSAFQNPAALTYDPQSKGTLAARREVARYYFDDHQTTVDPESLFLTTSTSEAYSYAFRLLCNPGDELLLPKPSYPLFEFLAGLQDVRLAPYSLAYAHGWFIDFQSLERALTPRTRAILLVHPNNPTGSYVHPEELALLNALCRSHNLALIIDEVFLDFAFDSPPRKTFAANFEVLTFTLSGLSKISALPQMKIAWLAVTGPDSHVRPALDRLEIIADTYLSLSAPAQAALPALLAQRHSLRPQLQARIRKSRPPPIPTPHASYLRTPPRRRRLVRRHPLLRQLLRSRVRRRPRDPPTPHSPRPPPPRPLLRLPLQQPPRPKPHRSPIRLRPRCPKTPLQFLAGFLSASNHGDCRL